MTAAEQEALDGFRQSLSIELVANNILSQGFEWPPSQSALVSFIAVERRTGMRIDAHKGVCVALADLAIALPGVAVEWGVRQGMPHEPILRSTVTGEESCAPFELALELEGKHGYGYLEFLDVTLRKSVQITSTEQPK